MTWAIQDQMARGGLFQIAAVTAVTDKFRIALFCMLFARVSCLALCAPKGLT